MKSTIYEENLHLGPTFDPAICIGVAKRLPATVPLIDTLMRAERTA